MILTATLMYLCSLFHVCWIIIDQLSDKMTNKSSSRNLNSRGLLGKKNPNYRWALLIHYHIYTLVIVFPQLWFKRWH